MIDIYISGVCHINIGIISSGITHLEYTELFVDSGPEGRLVGTCEFLQPLKVLNTSSLFQQLARWLQLEHNNGVCVCVCARHFKTLQTN